MVRGAILGLTDRELALSGEPFVRDLLQESKLGMDESGRSPVVSAPRIESFKDDNEARM